MLIPLCFLTIVAYHADISRDYPGLPLWAASRLSGGSTHGA